MGSGKLTKKPDDLFREKINARTRKTMIESGKKIGRLTDSQKITPSQRRSELAKKKDLKRAGVESAEQAAPQQLDCRDCNDECLYDNNLVKCHKPSRVHRCRKCGTRTRYRWIEDEPWELCPVCRIQKAGGAV